MLCVFTRIALQRKMGSKMDMMMMTHNIGYGEIKKIIITYATLSEPRRDKTGFLHMRKQRRRSASR